MSILLRRRGLSLGHPVIASSGTVTPAYFAAASKTTAGTSGGGGYYKDVSVTGCAVGDLLIAYGITGTANTSRTRNVATQSGTTSAWTTSTPAVSNNSDVDFIGGYATVSAAGTVTVRVTTRPLTATDGVFAGVFRVPAASVGATRSWATTLVNDADGQASVTLGGNSWVLYLASDWTASSPGASTTPSGATVVENYFDNSTFSVVAMHWQNQAAGTRNYGPSGLSGKDYSGSIFRMDM